MGRSHEPAAAAGWLGCCLAINLGAQAIGHGPVINPVVALVGAKIVHSFAAGKNSPDVDLWLPFVKHRGATHQVGTLVWFSGLSLALLGALAVFGWMPPFGLGWLVLAPSSGWWWHVITDRGWSALGFRTGGLLESGRILSPRSGAPGRGVKVLPAIGTLTMKALMLAAAGAVVVQWVAVTARTAS